MPTMPEVRAEARGRLGLIELNRPRSINALTLAMVRAIAERLTAWAGDDAITAVALSGSGDRGFCSGGDVRALRESVLQPADPREPFRPAQVFWKEEYALTKQIADYPKPVAVLMDGVVMGGGLGLSAFADVRLVTRRTRVAMPETIIGFFPDVGASFPLSRAPGETGTHLVMTGATATGADAIAVGLADAMIEREAWPDILQNLAGGELPSTGDRPDSPLMSARTWIDPCYAGDDPAAIHARLAAHPDPAAREAADVISRRSPLSVAVALAAIRRARVLPTVSAVLEQDLRLGVRFAPHADLLEGVRAQLVDRDFAPRWRHRDLSEVDPAEVTAYFDSSVGSSPPF